MKYLAFLVVFVLTSQVAAQSPVKRVLFGSCIKQNQPTPIFVTMKAFRPQLLLFTGDNIYGDTEDPNEMRSKYAKLAANRSFDDLIDGCKVLATWDDHDFGVNDGGADYPKKAESQKAFLDFWNVPTDSKRRNRKGVYHSELFGPVDKRLQVICLDTRYFRSTLKKGPRRVGGPYYPDKSSDKTILGQNQWKWLEAQLNVPAEIRLVLSSIQFVPSAAGQECWANLPNEREKMFQLLRDSQASGVIFISGDRHWSEVSMVDKDLPYPIYDFTCSSLNQIHKRGTPTENQYRVSKSTYHRENFGVLDVDWEHSDPQISISYRDIEGTSRIAKTILLSQLKAENLK